MVFCYQHNGHCNIDWSILFTADIFYFDAQLLDNIRNGRIALLDLCKDLNFARENIKTQTGIDEIYNKRTCNWNSKAQYHQHETSPQNTTFMHLRTSQHTGHTRRLILMLSLYQHILNGILFRFSDENVAPFISMCMLHVPPFQPL